MALGIAHRRLHECELATQAREIQVFGDTGGLLPGAGDERNAVAVLVHPSQQAPQPLHALLHLGLSCKRRRGFHPYFRQILCHFGQ